ncbi:MAG: PD-(D/E)XK nuclease family protein [Fretibacterium sp.]|nr:PD-(D/E)XK nuclease family protein [Fretibacterium sp.]
MKTMRKMEKKYAVTVSDLALCQRCPRLLAYHIHKGEESAWRIGIEGSGQAYGSFFHKHIAQAFFEAASAPGNPLRSKIVEALRGGHDGAESLSRNLEWVVRDYFFAPFLKKYTVRCGNAERIMAMAAGTNLWVRAMAAFLSAIPSLCNDPEKNLSRIFFKPEQKLQATCQSQRGTLQVGGCYDALLFNPDQAEATIFEFKSYRRSDLTGPLSQALIYAWLVREATGILPAIQVIYLEEGESDTLSADSVQGLMASLPALFDTAMDILSLRTPIPAAADKALCSSCPFEADCDGDWGTMASAEDGDVPEAQARMNQLLGVLADLGLSVTGEGYNVGPAFIRLKVKPDPRKTTVARIMNRADDLQVQMQLGMPPLIQAMEGYVGVDIPRAERKPLTLDELIQRGQPSRPASSAAFPLGMAVDGSIYWVDLTDPNMSSILVGGMSGSGKSVLLRSIIIGLLFSSGENGIRFLLIDPKRVTFSDMRGLSALQGGDVIYGVDEAMQSLKTEVEEMEQRFQEMADLGVDTLDGLNAHAQTGTLRERHVVIIDEYADLMMDRVAARELELLIQRIAQKGRAAGLHLILATQRPQAKVVTGLIKSNLQLHIALKVASRTNSQIILDYGGAQNLLGYGDMLVGGGMGLIRLQGALADTGMLEHRTF